MSVTDIIVIIAVILFILSGLRYGFIHTFGNLIGMILGFAASTIVFTWLQKVALISQNPWLALIIFLFIALLISGIVGWLVGLIDEIYKLISFIPLLKPINKISGAFIGLIEAIVAMIAFMIFVPMYLPEGVIRTAIAQSKILSLFIKPAQLITDWVVSIIF